MTLPTIQIDLWLLGWAQTHNTGSKIVFQISEDDLEHFKSATVKKGNRAGQRYAAVLVEVGDDELPVSAEPEKATPAKPAGYPPGLTGLAVQWCQDERFHDWLREVHRGEWMATACDPAYQLPEATAKRVILALCQISSRKELDTNPEAAERFETLIRQPFRKVLAEE